MQLYIITNFQFDLTHAGPTHFARSKKLVNQVRRPLKYV